MEPLNPLLLTDSYKIGHALQYPPDTTNIYSYFESRGGRWSETVFCGLQYILKKHLQTRSEYTPWFTASDLHEAKLLMREHFMGTEYFEEARWKHVLSAHDGHLPVKISAVAEGSVVPTRNVLMTVENTCPECFWATNWLETLLVQTWYPTTVATLSYHAKKIIAFYLERTGDLAGLPYKLHDFGFRGATSVESAGIGGWAHLVNFKGTDTLPALHVARAAYGFKGAAGVSIPASEHSTITSWGPDHEVAAMKNMLDRWPTATIACVSDSYDILRACSQYWGGVLRSQVMGRKGTLVVRPDSGEPVHVIVLQVLQALGKAFGTTTNSKGYLVLPPQVRVIQGDGNELIGSDTFTEILSAMEENGWSADNIAFGMGGGLHQQVTRDTQKFAFKCSHAVVNGKARDVFKDPITDRSKRSKRGRLALVQGPHGTLETLREGGAQGENLLTPIWNTGKLLREWTHDEIATRAQAGFGATKMEVPAV